MDGGGGDTTTTSTLIPLWSWIESEKKRYTNTTSTTVEQQQQQQKNGFINIADRSMTTTMARKQSLICQTTVAYGIVELLKYIRNNGSGHHNQQMMIQPLYSSLEGEVHSDNFYVLSANQNNEAGRHQQQPWDDIKGVCMLSSGLSVSIEEPSYLSCLDVGSDNDDQQISMGRSLEVEVTTSSSSLPFPTAPTTIAATSVTEDSNNSNNSNNRYLYLLARVLYELYTHEPFPSDNDALQLLSSKEYHHSNKEDTYHHHHYHDNTKSVKKLMLSRAREDSDVQSITIKKLPHVERMKMLGTPSSICLLVQNLLECCYNLQQQQQDYSSCHFRDAYKSLEEVANDLHLLLFDPNRFLFDRDVNSNIQQQLHYRKGKLYGRDKEETLITDTFCRVTRGKSEALFIGGYSGSGKSMLVDTVRVQVKNVGGYVIKHKFDETPHHRPLLGVILAINQLCSIIKARLTPTSLVEVARTLSEEFGEIDLPLLARLLPNACQLSPEFISEAPYSSPLQDEAAIDTMNLRGICFTLVRFMRVVSSPRRPVMLFLDDLQWADEDALEVVHSILSDTMGSCMFFVGSYRDNEVSEGHAMFEFIDKLENSNVPKTKISLTGLCQEDLNVMVSDALCLYPRICKPLSDIVFQKTKGGPFFVLEFMQSLLGRGVLQYNLDQKRWVWNENIIRSEEVTNNVLYLLSSKMNDLPENARTILKVMACFGTSVNESVISCLSKLAEYSSIQDWLKSAIRDGFVIEDGDRNFKFVHDKVREAAYNLIPNHEKDQFHCNLGFAVLKSCHQDVSSDETIFLIASQINHGADSILKNNEELRTTAMMMNMKAGKRAVDRLSHQTAYSYFHIASSMLPQDQWENQYDLTLQLSFLLASAANCSCKYDEAQLILQTIIRKAQSTSDKLPAYFLLCNIFQTHGKLIDAYKMYSSALSQLGETIPDTVTPETSTSLIRETVEMFKELYNEKWQKKKIEDDTIRAVVKFYTGISLAAYFFQPREIVTWFICKAAQLCLQNGMCQFAPVSFVQFTVFALDQALVQGNAPYICRIGNDAIALLERFNMRDRICACYYYFYAGVAWHAVEPLQSCADKLTQAFSTGLSAGNTIGLFALQQAIYFYTFSGKNLNSLLAEIDYYLHLLKTYKNEVAKRYVLNSRELVCTLIDKKGKFASIDDQTKGKIRENFLFLQAIAAYWSGHTERFKHFTEKCFSLIEHVPAQFNTMMLKFYHGLYSLETFKKKSSKEKIRLAIAAMRDAASNSTSNFQNKYELLEAERCSLEEKHEQAIAFYDASIASAKKSRFIHEQGLACEKAGFHCKKQEDASGALKYFTWAQQCYTEWGSTMKVEFIQREVDRLNSG